MVSPLEILDILNHPQALHSALVHAPIILAMIGALLCSCVLLTSGRNVTLRIAACVCLTMVLVSALAAANAGEKAFALMGDVTVAARQTAATHRWMAQKIWMLALMALLASTFVWAKPPRLALTARIGAAIISGILAAWVGLTAHHGGALVYQHGVGVPMQSPPHADQGQVEAVTDPRIGFFTSEVHPLLATHCMSCHGPGEFAANGLSLTSPAGFLKGGKRGLALVPGNPESSLLLKAVKGENMPRMPYNQPALTKEQIATLERWIREGAVWR